MSKKILVLGAGKSATCLITYLLQEAVREGWQITIADSDVAMAQSKTGHSPSAQACFIDIRDAEQRRLLIRQADLVIALLPPPLLPLVAVDCIETSTHLITASYLDQAFKDLQDRIYQSGILVLGEMGLDPGIDHMSAMKRIDEIRQSGGRIISFLSHCGGLVSPESDDNPLHYKVSWNPRNIVLAGNTGAIYRENGELKEISYASLFHPCKEIIVPTLGKLAYYPNRDSLAYQTLYDLQEADSFVRTTLRHPDFCKAWHAVVAAGLTHPAQPVPHPVSFYDWSLPLQAFVTSENRWPLQFLGLFDTAMVPSSLHYAADVVQYLMEKNLPLQEADRDMVVMLHQITYALENKKYRLESLLVRHGKDRLETAMATTVGLPLGIAAKFVLQEKIRLRGLHIPTRREVYEPVLPELSQYGIVFQDRVEELSTTF